MVTGPIIVMLMVFASQVDQGETTTTTAFSPSMAATPAANASATASDGASVTASAADASPAASAATATASDGASVTASAADASPAASAATSATALAAVSATASAIVLHTPASPSMQTAASQTVAPTPASSSSTTAGGSASVTTSSTSVTPIEPSTKTCVDISVIVDMGWNASYTTNMSRKAIKDEIQKSMDGLYNDSNKYTHVKVLELSLKEKERKIQLTFKLCMVFKKSANGGFIEDVFVAQMKTGKLNSELEVIKDSAKFKAVGVTFTDFKAKDGECNKICSKGAGGPFVIERTCEAKTGYSCYGLKNTQKSSDCVKYCDSSDGAIIFPSVVLALGIILPLSFNIWK